MQSATVLEMVLFKPKADFSRETILGTLNALQSVVEGFDGFVQRQVMENEDGQWVDLVWWESLEQALAASELVSQDASLAPHFAIFEDAEMQMLHLHKVALEIVK